MCVRACLGMSVYVCVCDFFLSFFRVIYRDHHHDVGVCLMLLYDIIFYGVKKTRHVDVTSRCHMGHIMPDSIFCESMSQGIICIFFFYFILFYFILVF